jgi:hypothetical protein
MKKLFYSGAFLLLLFEIANVYFIMPLPGSQELKSIDIAYFLYSNRFFIRIILGFTILAGLAAAFKGSKWLSIFVLLVVAAVMYMVKFEMAADTMFYEPGYMYTEPAASNNVSEDRLVLGVALNGEARAYPIQFIGYHHKVFDTIGGKPIMVTYCTVCRSGRVFEPVINGKEEKFRLVGMDHFNAMFEDKTTNTWWRQVTGEAIAGPLKGQKLPEVPTIQTSMATWLALYPYSRVMQPDSNFQSSYDDLSDYESGLRNGDLTRRDSSSWKDKSWIAGIVIHDLAKAYDWNELVSKGVILDKLDIFPIAVLVTKDERSLFAFIRTSDAQQLAIRNDTLTDGVIDYTLVGKAIDTSGQDLTPVPVYQEYWHSWKTFHPETIK